MVKNGKGEPEIQAISLNVEGLAASVAIFRVAGNLTVGGTRRGKDRQPLGGGHTELSGLLGELGYPPSLKFRH